MALTRKFLTALGIEADKIDEIIEAHTDTVDALKKERDDAREEARNYKTDAEKLPIVQQELDGLKDANSDNPYKEQYDKEHKAFEDYKAEVIARETKAKQEKAYAGLLKDAGVSEKRIASIIKLSPVGDLKFDKDDKVVDADKLTENIKKEWADFIVTEETKGAETKTPPAGGEGGKPLSRAAEIAKKHYEAIYGKGEK